MFLKGWRVLNKPCLEKAAKERDSKKLFTNPQGIPAFQSTAPKLCSPWQELRPDRELLCFLPSFNFLLLFSWFMLFWLRTIPQWNPGVFWTIENVIPGLWIDLAVEGLTLCVCPRRISNVGMYGAWEVLHPWQNGNIVPEQHLLPSLPPHPRLLINLVKYTDLQLWATSDNKNGMTNKMIRKEFRWSGLPFIFGITSVPAVWDPTGAWRS